MEAKKTVDAGRIVNTHGIAGEVKIEVWLDSPEFMKSFRRLFVSGREMKILSSRVHKGFLIAKLEGIDDINAAMPLKGKTVTVLREDAPLEEGEMFIQDIIGFAVEDENGDEVGKLTEVMETPAGLVYVVNGKSEHLIPDVDEFILDIDCEKELIKVHLIEGM